MTGAPRTPGRGDDADRASTRRGCPTRFLRGVAAHPGDLRFWGITDAARVAERTPTFAHHESTVGRRAEMAEALGRAGIFAWDGHFYAQALIERLGLAETGGVLRLGFVHYNTVDEVDRTLDALEAIARAA